MKIPQLLLLVGAVTATGQTARIDGQVLAVGGEPVRGANVHLSHDIKTVSDADGKFTFEAIAPGRYQLNVDKAGFLRQAYGQRSARDYGAAFALEAGQTLNVVISLTPQSVIVGRVLDQDGDPVAGAQVRARPAASLPQQPPDLLIGGTTDDQGYFRIASVDPGRYYLIATPPAKSPAERPSRSGTGMAVVATYYPSALDRASAKALNVTPGVEFRGADIRLRLERVYSIRGTITGSSSAIIFAQNTAADVISLMGTPVFQSAPDGSFELRGLIPGDYRIYATSGNSMMLAGDGWSFGRRIPGESDPGPAKLARVEVSLPNSDLEGVVLPLMSVEVAGAIRAEDDLPAAALPRVSIRALEGFALNVPTGPPDNSGAFQFTAAPSKYLLSVATPPGTYVKSARFDGADVTHAPLDLTKGGGSLDILLSKKVAEIIATARDGDGSPMPGMLAVLWPTELEATSSSGGIRIRIADQKGEFHFSDLPPGEYYVAALEGMEPTTAQLRDFLAHFTGEASSVALQEGAHQKLDVTPIAPDKIADVLSKMQEESR